MLTHEQIREHFASTDLETSQMLKVLQYLKLQGIMIEGDTAPVESEEVGETEPGFKRMYPSICSAFRTWV